jgi:hypothetical protein
MKRLEIADQQIFVKLIKIMPRLIGKNSYTPLYTTLGLVALGLGVATAMEYLGVIDVVPGFGQGSGISIEKAPTERPIPPGMK